MKLSEQSDKIAAALVAVGDEVRAVRKSGNNTFDKYTYAKLDDYVRACADAMKQHGVTVLASCTAIESLPTRKTKSGSDAYATRLHMTMRAVHSSGQWAEIVSIGEGEDRSDKSVYKANTGARKYGYAMLFGLTASDDAEVEDREPTKTTRAVVEKSTEKQPPGVRAMEAVGKWSGVKDSDLIALTKKIVAQLNLKIINGKMTDVQADEIVAFVDANKGNDFTKVVK